jgi:XTP/dITP diphosphohydrolase
VTPTRIVVATRSAHKLGEIRAILTLPTIELASLDDIGLPPEPDEDAIERFDTFRENAQAKAAWFAARTGLPTIADDSGIAVDALDGRPGVRSKRFSGRTDVHGSALDRANNDALLNALAGVPVPQRTARYVCAAALHGAVRLVAIGTVAGRILDSPAGNHGFGYDPIFLVPALDRTFGQLDAAAKHGLSHRGRAFRGLAAALSHMPAALDARSTIR